MKQSLVYGLPFTLVITHDKTSVVKNKNLSAFLFKDEFTYETENRDNYICFNVHCDDLTDATRIETFLQTEK